MRKADLILDISKKTGISKIDVMVTLENFFTEIKDSLTNGENIYVRGFGSFIVKKRNAPIGRNVKKNTIVQVPERLVPFFKPAKEFMLAVRNENHFANKEKLASPIPVMQ